MMGKVKLASKLMAPLLVLALLLSILATALPPAKHAHAQPADTPWPMFRHDLQHTGRSAYAGPETPGLKWSVTTGHFVISSPAIGADGTIYVGSFDNNLYAIWAAPPGEGGLSGTAIAGIIVGAIAGAGLIFFAVRKWVWKR